MKDNDKIIKNNRVYDAELKIINPFLEELKNNQSVECISIMPSYIEREEGSFCSIRIIIYAMGNSNELEYIQNCINSFLGELFYKKYKIINNISVEI